MRKLQNQKENISNKNMELFKEPIHILKVLTSKNSWKEKK